MTPEANPAGKHSLANRGSRNGLAVTPAQASRSLGDDELHAAAHIALSRSGEVNATGITLRVSNGVVTAKGTVESYWQRARAGGILRELGGVRDVKNDLTIVLPEEISDLAIAWSIVSDLEHGLDLSADAVAVEVDDGRVSLTGSVPSWQAYCAAYKVAAQAAGVKDVVANLSIEEEQ